MRVQARGVVASTFMGLLSGLACGLWACGGDVFDTCGDGICDPHQAENLVTCPQDCGSCGDGTCNQSAGESSASCAVDCPCGDGFCDPELRENCTCEVDCGPSCGNGWCDCGETDRTCPCDCSTCAFQTCSGHGRCVLADCHARCDCDPGYHPVGLACDPDPVELCGNGVCDPGESCSSCPADCSCCGNGMLDPGEPCDGGYLGGASCSTLGWDGGHLACTSDCSFDTSDCRRCGNGIIETPEQCDGRDLGGQDCSALGYAGGILGCSSTCRLDTSRCTTTTCTTGDRCDCPRTFPSAGSTYSGSTTGMANDFTASCGDGAGGPDVVFSFTPTTSGTWRIDTEGSAYDTVLHVRAGGCPGTEIPDGCNDDFDGLGSQSQVTVTLSAGVTYYVVVDGYGPSSSGGFVLNATRGTACTDDCSASARQCTSGSTTDYETCADHDGDGCTEWGARASCPTGQICSGGTCATSCTDECSTGTRRCVSGSATSYETCGNYDTADPCTEWGGRASCPTGQICSGGSCVSSCGNGIVDSGEECDGGSRSCTAACGSGTQSCTSSCTWGTCRGPSSGSTRLDISRDYYVETVGTSFTCPNNMQLRVSYYTGGRDASYIYFSISSLPSASETSLTSASLRIYVATVGGTLRRNVIVAPIDRTFYEGTCTVPGYSSASTVASFWPAAGMYQSVNIGAYLRSVWQEGSGTNNGLVLDWESSGDMAYIFDSRTGAHPPYVDVEYTCP